MTDNQQDNTPVNAPDDAASNIEAQPFSVGSALREARTKLGLNVADVAHRIKFAPRQIETLEADDFIRLPEITFVRGFVRSYARLLQIDPSPLLAALPATPAQFVLSSPNMLAEVPFPNINSARRLNIIWLAAALVIVIVLALFVWLRGNAPHVETLKIPVELPASSVPDSTISAPAMTAPQQVAVPAAPAVQQAAAPVEKKVAGKASRADAFRLVFDEESWVEVTDKEGKILLSQINPRDSEQGISGKPPFSVVIGHASGVRLYYKGKAVDLAPHTDADVARLTLE